MHLCENKRGSIEDHKRRHDPLDEGKGRQHQEDNVISHPDQKIRDFLPGSKHHDLNLSLDLDQKMLEVDPTSQDQKEDDLHPDQKMDRFDPASQDRGNDVASDLDHKMEESDPKEDMNDRQVKIFSMSSEDAVGEADEHLLIIHINKNQTNGEDQDQTSFGEEPSHKRRRTNSEPMSTMASNAKNVIKEHVVSTVGVGPHDTNSSSYKCFYCQVRCSKRIDCARHMLTHLPS
uniref:uncharacterized protein LOC100184970 isoform X2 n=1 Tax=Ciona intestinalis TaxID=7719 RepID=UPI000180D0C9|nr:uncharacterized protein LOC100184970 isoform X2 [Ciona intestinalis]|eukprot:XP_018668560.1 uncharacterized protein LOC100184970 isoform X2 [Ciona intestinalis]